MKEAQKKLPDQNDILYIFDKQDERYLRIDAIQQWFKIVEPILQDLPGRVLVSIFTGLAEHQIFDKKFIQALCDDVSSKLVDLSYSSLSAILNSLHKIKFNNVDLIQNIVKNLVSREDYEDVKYLSQNIWVLSKLGFRDESFAQAWLKNSLPVMHRFKEVDLTKSIQGFANLGFFDQGFIEAWIARAEANLDRFEKQALLNNAFHLTMISVNNFESPLKAKINQFIGRILSKVDASSFEELVAKQQLLQIYLAKVVSVGQEEIISLRTDIKQQVQLTTSKIQRKTEGFIKRVFPGYTVKSEYYDETTASFIDLMVERDSDQQYNFYAEVDGPSHYYINNLPSDLVARPTASTEFRNKLHALNGLNPYIIPYTAIDNGDYYAGLLEAINTFPKSYTASKQAAKAVDLESETSEISHKAGKVNNNKKKPTKAAKKAIDDQEFDQILKEFVKDNQKESLESQYKSVLNNYAQIRKNYHGKNLLWIAINKGDLSAVEIILQYNKDHKIKEEFDSFLLNDGKVDLLQFSLGKISDDRLLSKKYLEMASLLLDFGAKVKDTNEYHMKALLYSFGYGDVEMFKNFLALYPETSNKKQLMEFFFVNCGSLNHLEIAEFLLHKNIDINSCYSREALEVMFAGATGAKHNGKVIEHMPLVIDGLNEVVKLGKVGVEKLLQFASSGEMDKGEGVPEGRGVTALHLSCYHGEEHNDIRLFLLNAGANPNTMNGDGFTPLITSLLHENQNVALQLLRYKPNVNLKAKSDLTAAHIAAVNNFQEVIKEIISFDNVDLNVQIIVSKRNDKIQKLFNEGDTPLSLAIMKGHLELAEDLIDAGVELNNKCLLLKGKGLVQPLYYCIVHAPSLVSKLLANGAKVNLQIEEMNNMTPLMLAAEIYNPSTNRKNALQAGMSNFQEIYNNVALKRQEYKVVEQLLWYGADINLKDKDSDMVDQYTLEPYESAYADLIMHLRWREHSQLSVDIIERHETLVKMDNLLPKWKFQFNWFEKNVKGFGINTKIAIKLPEVGYVTPEFEAYNEDEEHLYLEKESSDVDGQVNIDEFDSLSIQERQILAFMLVSEFYKPIEAQEIYNPSVQEEQIFSLMVILAELHKLQAQASNIQTPILMIANEPYNQGLDAVALTIANEPNSGDENIEVFNIESALSSLNLGFKIGDIALDVVKLYQNPNKDNLQKVIVDLNYLSGVYYGGGVNYLAISGYNALDEVSNGNYLKAITQAATGVALAALPCVVVSSSYFAIPFGVALTSYNGYKFVINALNLIKEYDTPEQQLKSAQDYSNLYHYLSETSLQTIVDFDKLATEIDTYIIELIGEDVLES